MDAHALHRRGWTISAIARHLGHDRKTIRAYLHGDRVAGPSVGAASLIRSSCSPGTAASGWSRTRTCGRRPCSTRLLELGYDRSYPTFTRQLRARGLRPPCEPCRPAKGRPVAVIEHPPGEETQFDWLELPDPPAAWGWGSKAFLLVGALAHSGRWRGVLAESTRPAAPDRRAAPDMRRLGRADPQLAVRPDGHGLPSRHRPGHRILRRGRQALRGVGGDLPAPAREPQRRGGEGQPHRGATLVAHPARRRHDRAGPSSLDRWCALRGDARLRPTGDGRATVATVAAAEPLAPLPAPFPAVLTVTRTVSAQALVSFRGNHYSVPPELARTPVTVSHRLGATSIDIATSSGIVIARHRLAGRRRRSHPARHRPRHRPRTRRDGRVHHRLTAPPQAAHPTRARRASSRRGTAHRPPIPHPPQQTLQPPRPQTS